MKRDEALVDLSHDHHQALFVAMSLRRADEDSIGHAREAALAYWRDHGADHFRLEEDVLLPAYALYADPRDDAIARMLVDHVVIRARMNQLADDALALEQVHELGALLADHVRHEERTVFPAIEAALDASALAALAQRLDDAE